MSQRGGISGPSYIIEPLLGFHARLVCNAGIGHYHHGQSRQAAIISDCDTLFSRLQAL